MTLKNLFQSSLLILAFGFTACNSGNEESADLNTTDSVTASPVNAYLNSTDSNTAQPAGQPAGQPAAQVVTGGAKPNTSGGAPKLNPAHGQPGHDCAVEVGAPLPSGKSGAVQPVAQPTITTSPTPQPAISSGAKLNPAHGQPGHDCAVAVGAPLKN